MMRIPSRIAFVSYPDGCVFIVIFVLHLFVDVSNVGNGTVQIRSIG